MSIIRIGHIAFATPDVERASRFAQDTLGLREVETRDGVAYLTANTRHHQLRLEPGREWSVVSVGFDADSDQGVEEIAERASRAGLAVAPDESEAEFSERAIRFTIPHGPTISVMSGARTIEPERQATLAPVRVKKLGHVTLASEDCAGIERVLEDVLGMRLSDRLPLDGFAAGNLTWFRCNRDHHSVGLTPGRTGLHHYAWELQDFAAYAPLGDHLRAQGIPYVWGPGRHGPGDNLFAYFEDGQGGMIEVYCDMLQIDDEGSYQRTAWPSVADSANLWGPPPSDAWFEYSVPFAPTSDVVGTPPVAGKAGG